MPVAADHHVGLRTTDIDAAARFWTSALGGRVAAEPVLRSGPVLDLLYGDGAVMKVAQVVFDKGAIELFEFVEPRSPIPPTDQTAVAIMHFAFTVDDVDEALGRIEAAGGKRLCDPLTVAAAPAGPKFVYCETPEGHVFELVSVDHPTVVEFIRNFRAGAAEGVVHP